MLGLRERRFVIAAAIEWKILDLLLADESGGLLRGEVHRGDSLLDFHGLLQFADLEGEIDVDLLAYHEGDAGFSLPGEAGKVSGELVSSDWEGGGGVAASRGRR